LYNLYATNKPIIPKIRGRAKTDEMMQAVNANANPFLMKANIAVIIEKIPLKMANMLVILIKSVKGDPSGSDAEKTTNPIMIAKNAHKSAWMPKLRSLPLLYLISP